MIKAKRLAKNILKKLPIIFIILNHEFDCDHITILERPSKIKIFDAF